ncbi:hypothetical protein [Streptomyces sp. NPDC050485]|uniref:hypothetical protein n=1 Tax=Streptomyces sp. NPDC050485 TaxID=3365617 RepID=UPI0037BDC5DA
MKVDLALDAARKLLDQSSGAAAADVEVLARFRGSLHAGLGDYLRASLVAVASARIRDLVRYLSFFPSHSAVDAKKLAMAQQFLKIRPARVHQPSMRYVKILLDVLDGLEAVRLPAAIYYCAGEADDRRAVDGKLYAAVGSHIGSVHWRRCDRGLFDWPLAERPEWRHIQRLIQQRWVALLAVASVDELVPRCCTGHPQWGSDGITEWLASWGIRLVCLADAEPAEGDAP